MGKEFLHDNTGFMRLLEAGSDESGKDLALLCSRGTAVEIRKAAVLQPLLSAICLTWYRYIRERCGTPACVLGHSLGEITTLGAAGVVSDEEAVCIAAKRGVLMDEAASRCNEGKGGGMLAVLFVSIEKVHEVLERMNRPNDIVLANDNAPNQVVVSGTLSALEAFAKIITEQYEGKTRMVPVSGPWHSACMKEARNAFEPWIKPWVFRRPLTPFLMNATAKPETEPDEIKRRITGQLVKPVYWRQSMASLHRLGITRVVEIGPGKILSGLARLNGFRKSSIHTVNSQQDIDMLHSVCSSAPEKSVAA